jgi:hypothetical protein
VRTWTSGANVYLNRYFVGALLKKIRNCATMLSSGLCPMRVTGLNRRDFAPSACAAQR